MKKLISAILVVTVTWLGLCPSFALKDDTLINTEPQYIQQFIFFNTNKDILDESTKQYGKFLFNLVDASGNPSSRPGEFVYKSTITADVTTQLYGPGTSGTASIGHLFAVSGDDRKTRATQAKEVIKDLTESEIVITRSNNATSVGSDKYSKMSLDLLRDDVTFPNALSKFKDNDLTSYNEFISYFKNVNNFNDWKKLHSDYLDAILFSEGSLEEIDKTQVSRLSSFTKVAIVTTLSRGEKISSTDFNDVVNAHKEKLKLQQEAAETNAFNREGGELEKEDYTLSEDPASLLSTNNVTAFLKSLMAATNSNTDNSLISFERVKTHIDAYNKFKTNLQAPVREMLDLRIKAIISSRQAHVYGSTTNFNLLESINRDVVNTDWVIAYQGIKSNINSKLKDLLETNIPVSDLKTTLLSDRAKLFFNRMLSGVTGENEEGMSPAVYEMSKTKSTGLVAPRIVLPFNVIGTEKFRMDSENFTLFMDTLYEIAGIAVAVRTNKEFQKVIKNPDSLAKTQTIVDLANKVKEGYKLVTYVNTLSQYFDVSDYINYWYNKNIYENFTLQKIYEIVSKFEIADAEIEQYEEDSTQPFGKFYNYQTGEISNFLREGVAISSTFLPLETNINNLQVYQQVASEEFLRDFMSIYGDFRKAVFFVDRGGIAQQYYTNGGELNDIPIRPVTLRQMISKAGDLILLADNRNYQAEKQLGQFEELSKILYSIEGIVSQISETVTELPKQIGAVIEKTETTASRFFKALGVGVIVAAVAGLTVLTLGGVTLLASAAAGVAGVVGFSVTEIADETLADIKEGKIRSAKDIPIEKLQLMAADEEVVKQWKTKADSEKDPEIKTVYMDLALTLEKIAENIYTNKEIIAVFNSRTQHERKAYAVTSALIRDLELLNKVAPDIDKPLFISSNSLYKTENVGRDGIESYINYLLLANIKDVKKIDFKSAIDLDSPVYIDIFGNIVTESGYVVIPAIANMTLQNNWNPYTLAFLKHYGENVKADESAVFFNQGLAKDVLSLNAETKKYDLRQVSESGTIDISKVSSASNSVKSRLLQIGRNHVQTEGLYTTRYIARAVMPALYGAPLTDIDSEKFGLVGGKNVSKSGVLQAKRLEDLRSALKLKGDNTLIQVPNLTFSSGVEVMYLIIFRLTMLLAIFLVLAQIYLMAVRGTFSIDLWLKILGSVMMTFLIMFTVPFINEMTYYQVNKSLLQREAADITMLNLEKKERGVEVTMEGLKDYESDTKFYLKADELRIPYDKLFTEIIYSPIDEGLTRIYSKFAEESSSAHGVDGFVTLGDSVYIDVDEMLDSTTILMNENYQRLYQYITTKAPASFYTPYYAFLDSLISRVNTYNHKFKVFNYTMSVYGAGKLHTMGAVEDYFKSTTFMDEKELPDIFGISDIYTNKIGDLIFNEDDFLSMKSSKWYNNNLEKDIEGVKRRVAELDKRVRQYVIDSREMMGKISDSSYLKSLALYSAVQYNELFHIGSADSIEVFNIEPEEILRLSVLNKDMVAETSPYSYPRVVFENGGEISVYLAAILEVTLFVVGWIRKIISVLIFIVFYVSVFITRMILRKDGGNIKQYMLLTVILVALNLSYSFIIKLSMGLPYAIDSIPVSLIALTVMHASFGVLFTYVAATATKNWRTLGSEQFKEKGESIVNRVITTANRIANRPTGRDAEDNAGWIEYNKLKDKDKNKLAVRIEEDDI